MTFYEIKVSSAFNCQTKMNYYSLVLLTSLLFLIGCIFIYLFDKLFVGLTFVFLYSFFDYQWSQLTFSIAENIVHGPEPYLISYYFVYFLCNFWVPVILLLVDYPAAVAIEGYIS